MKSKDFLDFFSNVSENANRMKKTLIIPKTVPMIIGKEGLNKGLISGSDSFPPTKGPKINVNPAMTEP